MKEVNAYANAINEGSKFVKVDNHKAELIKNEDEEARNPYFLAVDKEDIVKEHQTNLKKIQ